MKTTLSAVALMLAATGLFAAAPRPAAAYQIDCAILLCLAGGWPPSAPCVAARAEFIRRITPWPIEPPLQIWRCPMGARYETAPSEDLMSRLWDVAMALEVGQAPLPVSRPAGASVERAQSNGVADIDISDPAFDFVRSIRVFSVEELRQKQKVSGDGAECIRSFRIRVGRYGQQGDFYWLSGDPSVLPEAYLGDELYGRDCPSVLSRSVFVDWQDFEGRYGFEQVTY